MEKLQTTFFFMRHGQTDRSYSPDPKTDDLRHLSSVGKNQIAKVGQYIGQFSPVAIYASPRHRTLETAEIIAQHCQGAAPVEPREELLEIYTNDEYRSLEHRIPRFFAAMVAKHPGQQVVVVSHQDTIQGGLDAFQLTDPEKDFPCQMAEGYRLVFAGPILVECQKIRPADGV